MFINPKMKKCRIFFEGLAALLHDTYDVVGSCNKDMSVYLIPKGTLSELSYYGKPEKSFRISDHWNWYSSVRKCSDESYVQCLSVDVPEVLSRTEPGKPTEARQAIQVSIYENGCYHAVYGDVFDAKTKEWKWIENDPANVVRNMN